MASRYRKSPVGCSRWKTMVASSGVSIPLTGAGLLAWQSMPLITPQ